MSDHCCNTRSEGCRMVLLGEEELRIAVSTELTLAGGGGGGGCC